MEPDYPLQRSIGHCLSVCHVYLHLLSFFVCLKSIKHSTAANYTAQVKSVLLNNTIAILQYDALLLVGELQNTLVLKKKGPAD